MQRGTNLTTIAEHTVDLSLLPEKANILDLGCRGFLFSNEMRRMGHWVVCVDMDDLPGYYIKRAVVGNKSGAVAVPILRDKDPQATRIGTGIATGEYVETITIEKLSHEYGVRMWDVIKLDIEGAEYEVIMSLTGAPATQLSIEFHLHTKIYPESAIKEMEDKLLSLGYFQAQHDKTSQHGCGLNYWDSLFILQQ